jgi:AraC-like DNA-binding protein
MELIAEFGLFSGLIALLIILGYSFRRSTNKIFLGFSLFFVWYSLLAVLFTITQQILEYPGLHRTGIVSAYLAFPFLYVYSRNTFYPGTLWRKTDWILLFPAVFYLIDFLPFFLKPAEEKLVIVRQNLESNEKMFEASEGWLGLTGFYFPFAYIWIAIIMYFQVRLIIANWHLETGFKSPHNRRLFNFIVTITILYLPLFIPGVFGILLKLSWFTPSFVGLTFGVSLSAISIYLFTSPKILYGFIPEKRFSILVPHSANDAALSMKLTPVEPRAEDPVETEMPQNVNRESEDSMESESPEEIAAEIAIVVQHMSEQKPFLQQGFTIQELSNQTGIPVYQLSPLINGHFKMNFANWVNRYRIEYFIEQVPENPQLTLEALSKKSGFISRSTFINAFKKEKGVTPREYFKELKLSA